MKKTSDYKVPAFPFTSMKAKEMQLRRMCHHRTCEDPDECPKTHDTSWHYVDCGKDLNLHTAMAWIIADVLDSIYSRADDLRDCMRDCKRRPTYSNMNAVSFGYNDLVESTRDLLGYVSSYLSALSYHREYYSKLYLCIHRVSGIAYKIKAATKRCKKQIDKEGWYVI